MALEIDTPDEATGQTINYWRVAECRVVTPWQVVLDDDGQPINGDYVTVFVAGWVSQAARQDEKEPVATKAFTMPLSKIEAFQQPGARDAIRSALYLALKERPDFANATDV